MRTKIVVGLAAAAILLAGCGSNGSQSTDPPAPQASTTPPAASTTPPAASATPASPAPSPSSASPPASPPASPSASPSAAASPSASRGAVTNPCQVIPAAATKALIGYTFAAAKSGTVAGSKLCSYVPASMDDPSLIAQEIALTGDFDRFLATAEDQLPGAKSRDIKVDGAEHARFVTAKLSGSPTVAILASANGVFYQVIIGGAKLDLTDAQKAATTYVTALITG